MEEVIRKKLNAAYNAGKQKEANLSFHASKEITDLFNLHLSQLRERIEGLKTYAIPGGKLEEGYHLAIEDVLKIMSSETPKTEEINKDVTKVEEIIDQNSEKMD